MESLRPLTILIWVTLLVVSLAYMLYVIVVRGLYLTVNGFIATSLLVVGLLIAIGMYIKHRRALSFRQSSLLAYVALASLLAALVITLSKP